MVDDGGLTGELHPNTHREDVSEPDELPSPAVFVLALLARVTVIEALAGFAFSIATAVSVLPTILLFEMTWTIRTWTRSHPDLASRRQGPSFQLLLGTLCVSFLLSLLTVVGAAFFLSRQISVSLRTHDRWILLQNVLHLAVLLANIVVLFSSRRSSRSSGATPTREAGAWLL
jgi:hypothetical protein